MSLDVPDDIWRSIAHFIPLHVLMHLYGVNHVLFELAMNLRYGEVRLFQYNKEMIKLLQRLQDPFIVRRVRILRVRPSCIQEIPDETRLLSNFLAQLYDLREYHVMWYDLTPPPQWVMSPTIFRLVQPMTIATSLRKLKLEASIDKLDAILLPKVVLRDLEEVDIRIRLSLTSEMRDNIAQFLNNSSQTLRSLSFQTCQPVDCSAFFNALTTFPALTSITLSIPSDKPHLGPWLPFQTFLNNHSESIKSLHLKGCHHHSNECTFHSSLFSLFGGGIELMEDWLTLCFASPSLLLPNLTSLVIDTRYYPLSLFYSLSRFANTITDLDLSGRFMLWEDIERVLSIFSPAGLQTLCIGPMTLSPELVDLFADKLPNLTSLDLRVKNVVPRKGALPRATGGFNNNPGGLRRARTWSVQESSQIDEFMTEMRKRTYTHWTLKKLAVWKPEGKKEQLQYHARYVKLLEGCIPSLAASSGCL